ncbi:biotin--[acetyl-CoA-carboxylase] ligase [Thermococcus sp. M39]|uniref:biotin--[acetyl-CoA-carboxylase] ligase n=1 Tax=unclassified Thermococcus TaxID=2627626 RepID=UPI00143A3DD2|nr:MULTISPECIES: biotin--[acetyl-CoA-carboxylase] ligase [unclassified Thermococcus]NJE07377.1 biotin--[acetyl-CoA-carboxylase] ligase [Thermococcus sp. M39]NJE12492.1 biotin--[acetyl-CoA-carboxylase] ligase [Thermococcus sp. LS2]
MLNLNTKIIGKKVIYLQEVDSTNEFAKKIAPQEKEGTVIVADVQTRGKGRKLRAWSSPRGGLWMSVILKPDVHPQHITKLVFISALAVVETLAEFGIKGKIKWPNDVLVNEKKICGILSEGKYLESRVEYVILGIGLNVNNELPKELKNTATSMREVLGHDVSLVEVVKNLFNKLDKWYLEFLKGNHNKILDSWRMHSTVIGKNVRIITDEGEIIGVVVDIDEDGALIIKQNGILRKIYYGDVSLRFA